MKRALSSLLLVLTAAGVIAAACSPPATPNAAKAEAAAAPVATPAAPPQLPESLLPPKEKGLPMWVVRDSDSTIYLTGTIHALPPETPWKSPKLKAALEEADEVWLEIAMTDRKDLQRRAAAAMQKYAASSVPLSSLLTEKERASLADFAKRMKMTSEQEKRLDGMKPWYVANAINASSLTSAGFEGDSGVDWEIARMAHEQGKKINGFETIDFQASTLAAGSDTEQLQQLRVMLAMPHHVRERTFSMMSPALVAWAHGDTRLLAAFFTFTSVVSNFDPQQKRQLDRLVLDRNENWAGQLEERLKGSGVSFVAVGGGHLVGPDSLQNRLKRRGIVAERY